MDIKGFTYPVRAHFLEDIFEFTGYKLSSFNQMDDYGQEKMWKMQRQITPRKRKNQITALVEVWYSYLVISWVHLVCLAGKISSLFGIEQIKLLLERFCLILSNLKFVRWPTPVPWLSSLYFWFLKFKYFFTDFGSISMSKGNDVLESRNPWCIRNPLLSILLLTSRHVYVGFLLL